MFAQIAKTATNALATGPALRRYLTRSLSSQIELLFPPVCALCGCDLGRQAACDPLLLCQPCRRELVGDPTPRCRRCSAPSIAAGVVTDCPHCRLEGWSFERVIAIGPYQGLLREAVLRTKQAPQVPLAHALAHLLWDTQADALRQLQADVLIPIPLHWTRRFWRGTNSPDTLGESLATQLRIPIANHLLRRRRSTRPQWMLTPAARATNVRGALAVRPHPDLQGACVLLLDDILTTGATCHEAARRLRRAGAQQVHVAVFARAAH